TLERGGVEASEGALTRVAAALLEGGECYPPHLQVYGDHLYNEAVSRGSRAVDEALVASLPGAGEIVFRRMTATLRALAPPLDGWVKRVLTCLITAGGARRRATAAD